MSKRTFWSKLNHDEARLAIDMMDDAEVGRWFRGWLAGAGGKEYSEDKVMSWTLEMRTGFASGKESFAEAEQYSQKQRDRVNSRYKGATTVHRGATTVTSGRKKATETLPSNSEQLTTNNEQQENINPLYPPLMGEVNIDRSAGEQVEVASEPQVENKPQIPVNGKRKRSPEKFPTLEEFTGWLTKYHPEMIETGVNFYKTFESQDWINGKGEKIESPTRTFNNWNLRGFLDRFKPKNQQKALSSDPFEAARLLNLQREEKLKRDRENAERLFGEMK